MTSIEDARNFSDAPMPSPQMRYRKAAAFTDLVCELWRSHPHEVMIDGTGYAPIDHVGEFFSVKGPAKRGGHPAWPPPPFQAGASDNRRNFAASVADAIDVVESADLRNETGPYGHLPVLSRPISGRHAGHAHLLQ